MKKRQSVQYTVRDIPHTADLRLRETAALEKISLNQAVLRALVRGLGMAGEPVPRRSLRHIVRPGDAPDREAWAATLAWMNTVNPAEWT